MSDSKNDRSFDAAIFDALWTAARLPADAAQQARVLPLWRETCALIDRLDEVELGESFPATAFDARRAG